MYQALLWSQKSELCPDATSEPFFLPHFSCADFSTILPSISCRSANYISFWLIFMPFICFLFFYPSIIFFVLFYFFLESPGLSVCLFQHKIPAGAINPLSKIKVYVNIAPRMTSFLAKMKKFAFIWKHNENNLLKCKSIVSAAGQRINRNKWWKWRHIVYSQSLHYSIYCSLPFFQHSFKTFTRWLKLSTKY